MPGGRVMRQAVPLLYGLRAGGGDAQGLQARSGGATPVEEVQGAVEVKCGATGNAAAAAVLYGRVEFAGYAERPPGFEGLHVRFELTCRTGGRHGEPFEDLRAEAEELRGPLVQLAEGSEGKHGEGIADATILTVRRFGDVRTRRIVAIPVLDLDNNIIGHPSGGINVSDLDSPLKTRGRRVAACGNGPL